MKKFKYIFLGLIGLALGVTSCEETEDENPVYQNPTSFTLNDSPYRNALVELANTETIEITCSQPDYGYTAAAEYAVQVSLDNNWDAANGFDEAAQTLGTKSGSCKIAIDANELAVAICSLMGVVDETATFEPIPVYLRVKCSLPTVEGSDIVSNPIVLNKVLPYFALPSVELPTAMYMIGNFCNWDWNDAAKMIAVNGNPDLFWVIRYVKAGEGFKFNSAKSWNGSEVGYDQVASWMANAANVSSDGGNIVVDKSGWYIFAIKTAIEGRDYVYEVQILEPNVYVYGAANGGTWGNDDNWKFDVVDDPDAEWPFVSPTVLPTAGTDDSNLRLCIHPDEWSSIDWWKSEFIFYNGEISYRADGGDQERVSNAAGKVYLNFVTGKAKVE